MMGCDGYLSNLHSAKELSIYCYECGEMVDLGNPILGHERCTRERNNDEVLPINIELDDYEAL